MRRPIVALRQLRMTNVPTAASTQVTATAKSWFTSCCPFPSQCCRYGSEMGRYERRYCQRIGGERAAGIEAKPADPQERCTYEAVCEVVRRHRLMRVTIALAQDERTDESRHS